MLQQTSFVLTISIKSASAPFVPFHILVDFCCLFCTFRRLYCNWAIRFAGSPAPTVIFFYLFSSLSVCVCVSYIFIFVFAPVALSLRATVISLAIFCFMWLCYFYDALFRFVQLPYMCGWATRFSLPPDLVNVVPHVTYTLPSSTAKP